MPSVASDALTVSFSQRPFVVTRSPAVKHLFREQRAQCIPPFGASVLRPKWIRAHYLLVLFRISRARGEENRPDSSRCEKVLFKDLFYLE